MNCGPRASAHSGALLRAGLGRARATPYRQQTTAATRPALCSALRPLPRAALPQAAAAIAPCVSFHSSESARKRLPTRQESSTSPPAAPREATDIASLDIFGDTPVPSTSVDICYSNGFKLNNGLQVLDGSGMLLVGGEAFSWRPWGQKKTLLNAKGQWEVDSSAFGLLGLVWPRPDLLILGLGPEMRPLSPETKRCITALGMRVEILDTRNAASQFNLLATERGVDDVAAALVPIGWQDGAASTQRTP